VTLNGKTVKTIRSGRAATIDLRGYRSGQAVVTAHVRLTNGRLISLTKRYLVCAPQRLATP